MSGYETYVEGLGDTIPMNRVSLEEAAILLEMFQEMCDPRISSGRLIELMPMMRTAWMNRGGDGVVSDVLNALYRWETAEAEAQERERQAADEQSDTHPWNHDTHGERNGER